MTHGRDHLQRENSRCRKGNTCIYGFPHPITPATWVDEQGRVQYKRTDEEDRWIASHIPELIDDLDCHIHVDVVFTVTVFMYLYKYLFKGPDHTLFRVRNQDSERIDEISDYVNGRYLSAPEAAWRIMNFEITSKEPSVSCLPVHLPGQNIPQFTLGEDSQGSTASLLIRYFHRPNILQFKDLTYIQYFQQYLLYNWNSQVPLLDDEYLEQEMPGAQRRKVCPRRMGRKIARLQTLSPTTGEVFYLRCLLGHVPAFSFEDLRTVNDVIYNTYHEAAIQRGLFSDVNEGYYALQEAVASLQTPAQLRFLFARVILEGYPAVPLWERFREDLILDYAVATSSEERGTDRALQQISEYLEDSRRSLKEFGLPEPTLRSAEVLTELEAFYGRHEDLLHQCDQMEQQMTGEQRDIFHHAIDVVKGHEHDSRSVADPIFIEGKPGRGKTFLVDALCSKIRGEGNIILIVGSSALSAALYERGRTAHSLFRIPVTEVSLQAHH